MTMESEESREADPEKTDTSSSKIDRSHQIFEARGLWKIYDMGEVKVTALRDVDFDLFEGELLVLLGASGSGKSTLLNILGGLDKPTEGSVRYRDIILSESDDYQLTQYRRQHVGFVFQFYHLLPELTILENATLPAMVGGGKTSVAVARDQAAALLEQFGLGHRLAHRPRELSGGERQRAAIARALVNKPSVLLADEPTGNLDEETGNEILDVLSQLHQDGLTVIVVTHNLEIAPRGDCVVHLRHGQIDHTATLAQ